MALNGRVAINDAGSIELYVAGCALRSVIGGLLKSCELVDHGTDGLDRRLLKGSPWV